MMSGVAILGAGSLGATLARTLARRDCVSKIRLIDPAGDIAAGKALDLQQAAPLEAFRTRLTASSDPAMAIGASVIAVADLAGAPGSESELTDQAALVMLRQVVKVDRNAIIVFAGARQRGTMIEALRDLGVEARRLVGTAPEALGSALRALIALEIDASPVDLSLSILGVPPDRTVIGWSEASLRGASLEQQLSPPQIARLNAAVARIWPPGPYALASAAARACEAAVTASTQLFDGFAVLDGETGGRGEVVAVPVRVDRRGVTVVGPRSLSIQERVAFENSISR